jgi:hypothetical protein
MAKQIARFQPKSTIPFASIIYFSNEENAYLNDQVNTPQDAHNAIMAAGSQPVVMFPGDQWTVGAPYNNARPLAAYQGVYSRLATLPLRPAGASVSLAELAIQCESYRRTTFCQNSCLLIHLLHRVPLLGVFRSVKIRLTDLGTLVSVSVVDGFRVESDGPEDVSMHSSSLAYIFQHAFGYDTLLVNGRFEATPDGFSRMSKSLAIGLLNTMGFAISPRLLLNVDLIWLVFWRLRAIRSRLSKAAPVPHAP